MMENCEKCNGEFQPWDKQFVMDEPHRDGPVVVLKTVCFLCACEMTKIVIGRLGVNVWNRPFLDLYRLLFPETESSFYVHVLQKALTEMYLEKWAEKPLEIQPIFTM